MENNDNNNNNVLFKQKKEKKKKKKRKIMISHFIEKGKSLGLSISIFRFLYDVMHRLTN